MWIHRLLLIWQISLKQFNNFEFYQCTVSNLPFTNLSMDFGYPLGVLHHIPDTEKTLSDCVMKLQPRAPFLIYLYYTFDNLLFFYRWLWKLSDIDRKVIWRLPFGLKVDACSTIAASVCFPLARFAKVVEKQVFLFTVGL